MSKNKNEDLLNAYVQENEYQDGAVTENPFTEAKMEPVPTVDEINDNISYAARSSYEPNAHQKLVDQVNQSSIRGFGGAPQASDLRYRDNVGWLKIPVETLPTKGLFYPDGFEISVRAARGEEIKHWSTMNDHDINQLSRTDDILNYMIEKCCSVKNPGFPGNSWKDLKNVDRFYILFTIKEFTFLDGENELMAPISEGKDIPVTKDMIDFISIPEEVMKFYNQNLRCFTFNVGGTSFNMHIPSIGVNDWLKKYAAQKINAKEGYDEDFLTYAPMLIRDHRGLKQSDYEEMVAASRLWGVKEWSVVSYVTDKLSNATEPKIKYTNEDGAEVEIPLSFRGGIRSLFVLSNPLLSVC